MSLVRSWLVNAVALYATTYLLAGVRVDSLEALAAGALAIGLINAIVRPILRFVTFPITVLTLGLFYFVLNGLMFYLAASLIPGFELGGGNGLPYSLAESLVPGFELVGGLVTATLGALVMSFVATALHLLFKPRNK